MKIEELNIIKQAILSEIEGYEFYKMASEQTSTQDSKQAYLELAQEELLHVQWLKRLLESIHKEEDFSYDLAFVADAPAPHLFNWNNLDRKSANLALSVFGIGIQMERAAVEFYKNASRKTQNTAAKDLYTKLASWEQVHLDQFAKQYDTLKDEWWSFQGFEPF